MERKCQNRRFTGEQTACFKYLARSDYHASYLNDGNKCRQINTDCIIEKLRKLLSDSITNDRAEISRLLSDYLREIDDTYPFITNTFQPVKHLPAVMKVIEFLARKGREDDDCRAHLNRMLHLCSQLPLLKRSSESFASSAITGHYFTFPGLLLTMLPDKRDVTRIHKVLECLLLVRTETDERRGGEIRFSPASYGELPIAGYHRRIAGGCCAEDVPETFGTVLHARLDLGRVLMDLPYATQVRCTRPPDIPLEGEEYSWDVMLLIMNLLWSLMGSVLPSNTSSKHLQDLTSLKRCAMWHYLLITIN
ncbi:hypothetical protein PUN28_012162 [Cardiocondyla obscurior]|uniref:Uncharacterized protein n=1 Tax=Cardiocondyla obscurior TaxID=286306 RepID=A0AAW2F9S3_9HYME